jgi:hypothetical protein
VNLWSTLNPIPSLPSSRAREHAEFFASLEREQRKPGEHFATTFAGRYPDFVCAYCLIPRAEWPEVCTG